MLISREPKVMGKNFCRSIIYIIPQLVTTPKAALRLQLEIPPIEILYSYFNCTYFCYCKRDERFPEKYL